MGQYLQLDIRSGQRKAPKAAVAVLDTQIAIASPVLKAEWYMEWGGASPRA